MRRAAVRLLLLFLAAPAAFAGPGDEPPGFHGMLLLGGEKLFVSHLPMFTSQHRYQGIWEVSFGDAADQVYRNERSKPENSDSIFTVAPKELFRLPDLVQGRESFLADVYLGHFERPGRRLLLEDVSVNLLATVHWQPFVNENRRPEASSYILFGGDGERFMAHRITRPPNYDHIVAVTLDSPPDDPVAQVMVPEQGDRQPLSAANEPIEAVIAAPDSSAGDPETAVREITIVSEYYLEQNELSFSDLPDLPED